MSGINYDPIPLPCPLCEENNLETTYTTYKIVGFRIEKDLYVSCVCCAKSELGRLAKNAFQIGWQNVPNSIVQFLHNTQIPFIKVDHESVHKALLQKIGLSENTNQINVALLGTYLAVSMIKADGKIYSEEINVAKDLGKLILPGFDEQDFQDVVTQAEQLPSAQIVATLLRNLLPETGKEAIFRYLSQISQADNESTLSEQLLLINVAEKLNLDPGNIDIYF